MTANLSAAAASDVTDNNHPHLICVATTTLDDNLNDTSNDTNNGSVDSIVGNTYDNNTVTHDNTDTINVLILTRIFTLALVITLIRMSPAMLPTCQKLMTPLVITTTLLAAMIITLIATVLNIFIYILMSR